MKRVGLLLAATGIVAALSCRDHKAPAGLDTSGADTLVAGPPGCGKGVTFYTAVTDVDPVAFRGATSRELLQGRWMKVSASRFQTFVDWWRVDSLGAITYCSTDTAVARMHGDTVIAVSAGAATIVATDGRAADSVMITVVSKGYDVTFLGDEIGTKSTIALNDSGAVLLTGSAIWRDHVLTPIGCAAGAFAFNNRGDVLCSGNVVHWASGAVDTIATNGVFAALNDAGDVAGRKCITNSCTASLLKRRGDTVMTFAFNPAPWSFAVKAINANGDFAGWADFLNGTYRAVVNAGGVNNFLSDVGWRGYFANDINDSLDVVGFGAQNHMINSAVAWMRSGSGWTAKGLIGPLGYPVRANHTTGEAMAINVHRFVVGNAGEAFVWHDNRYVSLNAVVHDTSWSVTSAKDINKSGQILVQVTNSSAGKTGPALLTPRP